jgi:hypothetical protein
MKIWLGGDQQSAVAPFLLNKFVLSHFLDDFNFPAGPKYNIEDKV